MDPEVCRLGGELAKSIKGEREKPCPDLYRSVEDLITFPYGSCERCSVSSLTLKLFLDSNTFTIENHMNAAQHLHRLNQEYDFKDFSVGLKKEWDFLVFHLFAAFAYDRPWDHQSDVLELYEKAFQELSVSKPAFHVYQHRTEIESLRVEVQKRELHLRDELIKAIEEGHRDRDLSAYHACFESFPSLQHPHKAWRVMSLILESLIELDVFDSTRANSALELLDLFHRFYAEIPPEDVQEKWVDLVSEIFKDYMDHTEGEHQSQIEELSADIHQKFPSPTQQPEADRQLKVDLPPMEIQKHNRELDTEIDELKKLMRDLKRMMEFDP